MKDKIYKLNRPKGFFIFKRAAIACLSAFICCVALAVPLSVLIYNEANVSVAEKHVVKEHEPAEKNQAIDNKLNELIDKILSFIEK